MLLRRTRKFYIDKVRIDKSVNQRTAYKIQLYNDYQVDELVKKYNEGETISKPAPSKLWADLAVLNKPEVYNNYNHIINSKYTSNDNLDNLIVKNLANKDLNRIVEAEVERISKNLDYAEQVMQKYEVPMTMYEEFKKEQAKNSISSRQQVLKDVAIKANDLLVSEGLNIPKVYTYRNIETTAENLLRQSQMGSKHQEILAINSNYKNQGKDEIYTGKEWIWTGRGETTRHRSNHLQKRQLKEPFIIVNDKTLHIDELMYPSDPAGSFSNAWICYCECQYLTGDARDYQYLGSLSLTDTKFKVNAPALKTPTFMNAKQFNKELNKPSPVKISQPVATNIQDYMNVNVGTSTPSLIDDSVDGVTSIPHNYEIDGSKVPVIYNAETGKYYYNGLELKEYDVQSQMGKVSKAAVTKHNNNITESTTEPAPVTAEFIDVSELGKGYGGYDIFDFDGVEYVNGKYYHNGLDITQYYDKEAGYALDVPKELIEAHNKQFTDNVTNDKVNELVKTPIDTDELINSQTGSYLINATNHEFDKIDGKYYYHGLEVEMKFKEDGSLFYGKVSKEVVEEHNKQFETSNDINTNIGEPSNITNNDNNVLTDEISNNAELIDLNKFKGDDELLVDVQFDGVVYNNETGHWEYKGLWVKDYSEEYDIGTVYLNDAIEHNNKLGGDTNAGNTNVSLNSPQNLNTSNDKYITNSKILKEEKNSQGHRFAVDEHGRKWEIDDEYEGGRLESLQDSLQDQVDMTDEYGGVHDYGYGGYAPINQFLYNKRRYEGEQYKRILDKVVPLLDDIRKATYNGDDLTALNRKFDKMIDEVRGEDSTLADYIEEMKQIDMAQAKAPALTQDTLMGRQTLWDLSFNEVGKVCEWDGYGSSSYIAEGVDVNSSMSKYTVTILVPKGHKGVRLSQQFRAITEEREWLLPRGQKFKVIEFDEVNKTATIELINYIEGVDL